MYMFHYKHIVPLYGERARLLFTDTDSLCYDIQTDDVYADMSLNLSKYDTSDYPVGHPGQCEGDRCQGSLILLLK